MWRKKLLGFLCCIWLRGGRGRYRNLLRPSARESGTGMNRGSARRGNSLQQPVTGCWDPPGRLVGWRRRLTLATLVGPPTHTWGAYTFDAMLRIARIARAVRRLSRARRRRASRARLLLSQRCTIRTDGLVTGIQISAPRWHPLTDWASGRPQCRSGRVVRAVDPGRRRGDARGGDQRQRGLRVSRRGPGDLAGGLPAGRGARGGDRGPGRLPGPGRVRPALSGHLPD